MTSLFLYYQYLGSFTPKKMIKNKGVSLIETIIGIVLLGFALTGASVLMQASIVQSRTNNSRIQAIYVAQKCLEISRNMRDSSWEQSRPWDCSFKPQQYGTDICESIPVFTETIHSSFEEQTLQKFTITPTVQSKLLDASNNSHGYTISCKVAWDQHFIENSHILTNWIQK